MSNSENLFLAIRGGDVDTIQNLVNEDPSLVAARNERGTPPLTLATYFENLQAAKILVAAGADVNASDVSGTALMGVSFKGFLEIAEYLISVGADVNAKSGNGTTALHYAAMFNKPALVDLLLKAGADAGAKDDNGLTAADQAKNQGLPEMAARLG